LDINAFNADLVQCNLVVSPDDRSALFEQLDSTVDQSALMIRQ
jgi:hypothetical protein